MPDQRCPVCESPVGAGKRRQVYCSQPCRLAAWALRKARRLRPHRRRRPPSYEVLEPEAIPREYLVVSAARIEKALRAGLEVPGIRKKEE